MTKLSIKINVKASKQRVWQIISHPERFPSFIKDVKNVVILQRDSKTALMQWKILIDNLEIQWTEQCRYDTDNAIISFHTIRGDFSSYDGTLALSHSGKGVDLILDATLDWGIPSFEKVIAKVLEDRVRRAFMGMLVSIKRQLEKQQPARSFGFVIHPLDLGLIGIAFREPNIASKRKDLLSKAFEWLPPFKCSDIVGLQSTDGTAIDGALIYCPLLPDQMVANQGEIALKRTIEAVHVAQSLGVGVVGLGAYAANIGRKGILVSEAVNVPVTTGTSYTIAIAIEGVRKACSTVGIDLRNLCVGIVGATGGIGSTCAELLSKEAGSLILNARNQTRLDDLVIRLKEKSPGLEISHTTELDWLIANADVIITATGSPASLINAQSLRPGTIVCDVSRPRNVSPESVEETHGSVLVFDGGIVKPPGDVDFDFYFGLPPGIAYACMAETMILALAEKYEGFSIGGNISADKVAEILKLGDKFGFKLAELRWCEREIPEETLQIVREHAQKRLSKSRIW